MDGSPLGSTVTGSNQPYRKASPPPHLADKHAPFHFSGNPPPCRPNEYPVYLFIYLFFFYFFIFFSYFRCTASSSTSLHVPAPTPTHWSGTLLFHCVMCVLPFVTYTVAMGDTARSTISDAQTQISAAGTHNSLHASLSFLPKITLVLDPTSHSGGK